MIFIRPDTLTGFTTRIETGFGNLYITINELDHQPIEVIATIGMSGQAIMVKAEIIGRLVSIALQNGVALSEITKQLVGMADDKPLATGGRVILSIPDAIGQVLHERYQLKE